MLMKALFIALILIFSQITVASDCSFDSVLKTYHQELKYAQRNAGQITDFNQRIDHLLELYLRSKNEFLFPLVALHGAIWARDYFEKTNWRLLMLRYNVIGLVLQKKLKKIDTLSKGLQAINRKVFIDITSKYYTILKWQECPDQLSKLNIDNAIIKAITEDNNKLGAFKSMLLHEQKNIVEPMMKKLEQKLKLTRFERKLLLRPKVRFNYFPTEIKFKFENFFDTNERIKYSLKAANLALEVGEDRVIQSID